MQVIDFELPTTVKLAVVDVNPGLRGDTVQGIILADIFSHNVLSMQCFFLSYKGLEITRKKCCFVSFVLVIAYVGVKSFPWIIRLFLDQ